MKWRLSHLRLAGLALPLLTAGCMSGVMPGADAPDPSCVLLCALTRGLAGEPEAQPAAVAAAPKAKVAAAAHPARKRTMHLRPPRAAKVAAASPAKPRKIATHVHPRPVRQATPSEVSVVPQTPARVKAPAPVAIAPAPPVAAAPPPLEAPRSLSQTIPGSAGIMVPSWQAQ